MLIFFLTTFSIWIKLSGYFDTNSDVSSYGRDMVQNGLGFMHSVSLKSHGPVLLSMKLLPYPMNQSCFPLALDKLNETALRRMVPAVTSLAN